MTFLTDDKPSLESVLEHHGVKGQHWGVRRADGGAIAGGAQHHMEKAETKFQAKRSAANEQVAKNRAAGVHNGKHEAEALKLNDQHKRNQAELKRQGLVTYKKSGPPAKLTRSEVRAEKNAFYDKKAQHVIDVALKKPNTLIKLQTEAGPTIVTGKEFVTHLSNGGHMNAKYTDIYATQVGKNGPYKLNENMNQRYRRSDKK